MNPQPPLPLDLPLDPRAGVPLDVALRIDKLCEEFERSLDAAGARPIESYLAELPASEQAAGLRELLAIELEHLARRGEPPSRDPYHARFPEHPALVALLFAELAQTETDGTQSIANTEADGQRVTPRKSEPATPPACLADHPRYKVLRFLGKGGMGRVYLAEHRVMDRQVALKVIDAAVVGEGTARERFHREIKAAARLHHPNIVTAFDAEQIAETAVFVMEYVPGENLAQSVAKEGPLPVEQAAELARQAALGLAHAHELGMVHRDIKPHNLMVTAAGQLKILDFGLAHFATDARDVTREGVLLGTVDYMAPEQADDPHAADIRSDLYSLGCTLYFLLSGTAPFPAGSVVARLKAHSDSTPPPLANVSPELAGVLAKMLAKSPADRYQRPEEVALALAPFAGRQEASTPAEGNSNSLAGARLSRGSWIALAAVVVVGALVAVFWPRPQVPQAPQVQTPQPQVTQPKVPQAALVLYAQASDQLLQRKEDLTEKAISSLKKAIDLEPNYLDAHLALANAYNLQADYGWEMPDKVCELARQEAQWAIEFDPWSSRGYLELACVLDAYDGNAAQAEHAYELALHLDYDSADAHHWYAWYLVQHEKFEDARKEIDKAAELEPAEKVVCTNRGRIEYFSGSYRVAIPQFQSAIDYAPEFVKAHLDQAMAYVEQDQLDKALANLDKFPLGQTKDGRDVMARKAYAYAHCGKPEEARKLLSDLEELSKSKPLAYEVATIYSALGEPTLAIAWLDKAFQQKSAWRNYLRVDPRVDGIRKEDCFQEYLKAIDRNQPD